MDKESFHGLWRASANERVAYTDDFPAAMLVTPEFWDGCIGQGQATQILTSVKQIPGSAKWLLTVRDNGRGITNERRLLTWAAAHATSNIHRNGHGLKKTLTKYAPDYTDAKWTIKYRRSGKNLQVISSPFLGFQNTKSEEVEGDETTLMPSGTEVSVEFDPAILGRYRDNVEHLTNAFRELICTRYSEEILEKVEFVLDITAPTPTVPSKTLVASSKKNRWHSLRWHVEKMVGEKEAEKIGTYSEEFVGGRWDFTMFHLTVNGSASYALKKPDVFPTYGRKNQATSRMFAGLNGRMIEAMPIYTALGKEQNHNNYNGMVWFLDFTAASDADFEKLPTPATTKVSFYENCEVFKPVVEKIRGVHSQLQARFDTNTKLQKDQARARAVEEERARLLAHVEAVQARTRAVRTASNTSDASSTSISRSPSPSPSPRTQRTFAPRAQTGLPFIPAVTPKSLLKEVSEFVEWMMESNMEEILASAPDTSTPNLLPYLQSIKNIRKKLTEFGVVGAEASV